MATKHPYGTGFAMPISKTRAIQLCGTYPVPRIGYETCIKESPDGYGGYFRLDVQNISGSFFLASSSVERIYWNSIFSIEGLKP